ncbi:MAG: sigma-70 family RNA polymerase sigma factor [Acidobacteriaceae bacterium]|nr:sigma-70 family RNA polymerase sigma factor [Acidobacteriaceae bacterium]
MLASVPIDAPTADQAISLPSFAEAVEAHKAMVYSIAWHFLRDRLAAEELAQEVFLQLHRNWSAMKSPDHMIFWLRKVTSHRAIDFARRVNRHLERSLEETAEPTTFERVHDTFLATYLERIVASLPEKQRIVIVLRYQEDMEVAEIARTLGMKPATVKTLLARALDLLRNKTERRLGYGAERPQPSLGEEL